VPFWGVNFGAFLPAFPRPEGGSGPVWAAFAEYLCARFMVDLVGILNDRGRFDFISLERPTDPLLANRGHALKIASRSNPGGHKVGQIRRSKTGSKPAEKSADKRT
jgi:hypothetical protein